VLWCYLLWYLVNVTVLFEPSPSLWLNSVGISAVIGVALLLSVARPDGRRPSADRWQTLRLFLMPFCVSSFAALIKGQDYFLVFPLDLGVLAWSLLTCATFVGTCLLLRKTRAGIERHIRQDDR
jgi:hypothetical protein